MLEEASNKVIYAGDLGSFSHQAAEIAKLNAFLADKVGLIFEPSTSPTRVIERLHAGEAAYGVIPFRNPQVGQGTITATEAAFKQLGVDLPPAELQGELWWEALRKLHPEWTMSDPIPVTFYFHVLAAPGVKSTDIERVIAYHVASTQCDAGFRRVIQQPFELVETYSDSAKAAADLRQLLNNPNYVSADERHESETLKPTAVTGVLANQACADLYNLDIVFSGVQNNPLGNTTTFVVLHNPWHQ